MRAVARGMTFAAVLMVAAWLLVPTRALGWAKGGHRVVANIAYDQLQSDPKIREAIVAALREHEDFKRNFAARMAKELPGANAADEERWIFVQAAIWPDLIRNDKRFHHDPWHYVNFPYYPFDGDKQALKGSIKPNLSVKLPALVTETNMKGFNCMQAFKLAVSEIGDSHNKLSEKALYYCWLFHIAGDVHQPLHSTSLVTRGRFNESFCDKGGHIPVVPVDPKKRNDSLHAFWDGLHGENQGESDDLAQVVKRSSMILSDPKNKKAGESARSNLNIKDWVMESHKIAKNFAYSKEMLKVVEDGESSAHLRLDRFKLPADYQQQAQAIANRRVAEAGYRLAELLKQLD